MIEINSKVQNKKLAENSVGVVKNFVTGKEYLKELERVGVTVKSWDELYPDWQNKNVYHVSFVKPINSIRNLNIVGIMSPDFMFPEDDLILC